MANGKADMRWRLGTSAHPKVVRLVGACGERAFRALSALWEWTAANRPDGSLKGMDAVDISVAAGWPDAPASFTDALLAARLLDGKPGRLRIHDWAEEQPWVAGTSERSESARALARRRWDAERNAARMPDAMRPASDAHAGRNAPSPSPIPSPTPLPLPDPTPTRATPGAAAAKALPPPDQPPGPDAPLASRLAARIRWTTVATVAAMLDELRTEGDTDATLEAAYAATPDGRQTPYDWAKATRKRRGPTRATEAERADAERTARTWAERAVEAEKAGDSKGAKGAWVQVAWAARIAGKTARDFGAPDTDTTTAACERERRAPATCRRVISTPSPPATMPLAPT